MALDLKMLRKGLDPSKTYYQIKKEEEEEEKIQLEPEPELEPVKRGRGRPKKQLASSILI